MTQSAFDKNASLTMNTGITNISAHITYTPLPWSIQFPHLFVSRWHLTATILPARVLVLFVPVWQRIINIIIIDVLANLFEE